MADFVSYPSIEEDFKAMKLSEEDYRKLNKATWIVTEKIHGANFCIVTNGQYLRYAKRKEILEDHDDFFGYREAMLERELMFAEAFENLNKKYPTVQQVLFYGELFGGSYPHPEVPNHERFPVQSGVYYSPNTEFMIFDILLRSQDGDTFLAFDELSGVCAETKLPYVPPLFKGKLTDALNFPIEFESTIPALLKLPALTFSNKAEGVVIKPEIPIYVETPRGNVRPVIKRKIQAFAEDFYTQSGLNASQAGMKQRILSMINVNRINSAISKTGRPRKTDTACIESITNLVLEDLLLELKKIETETSNRLNAKERDSMMTEIRNRVLWELEKMF